MHYNFNLIALIIVFSVVTYNVCLAYQDLDQVNVQDKFQKIGLIETPEKHLIPPRKPIAPAAELAAIQ